MSYGSPRFAFGYRLTPWVKRFLIANAVVHLVAVLAGHEFFIRWFGFAPTEIFYRPWSLVSYMFIHGDLWHLLLNMLVLFFFGPPLEEKWGSRGFLRYYFLCGMGGAALSFVFAFGSVPIVGASAAIYGLMLAFAWYWPESPIYVWGIFPVKAKYLVGFFFILTFVSAFGGAGGGVAHFAHLGGLVAGLIYLRAGKRISSRLGSLKEAASVERLAIVPRDDDGEEEQASRPRRRRSKKQGVAEEELLDEVDRILDKISDSGMSSLTEEERRVLDEVSRRRRTN